MLCGTGFLKLVVDHFFDESHCSIGTEAINFGTDIKVFLNLRIQLLPMLRTTWRRWVKNLLGTLITFYLKSLQRDPKLALAHLLRKSSVHWQKKWKLFSIRTSSHLSFWRVPLPIRVVPTPSKLLDCMMKRAGVTSVFSVPSSRVYVSGSLTRNRRSRQGFNIQPFIFSVGQHADLQYFAVLWIRIQQGKNDSEKKNGNKFHLFSAGCSLLRAERKLLFLI